MKIFIKMTLIGFVLFVSTWQVQGQIEEEVFVCDTTIVCVSCCYSVQAVPKFFPACYGECTGNLDHVFKIIHTPCSGALPEGYTSAFNNITISSGGTFGNCFDCSNPTSTSNQAQTSFNMAICSPGWQSVYFSIEVYDENGNLVGSCPPDVFSFYVPQCNSGPFDFGLSIYPNPSQETINWNQSQEILSVDILDGDTGQVLLSNSNPEGKMCIQNLSSGIYKVRFRLRNDKIQVVQFVKP